MEKSCSIRYTVHREVYCAAIAWFIVAHIRTPCVAEVSLYFVSGEPPDT
jgi:hypothetical protein